MHQEIWRIGVKTCQHLKKMFRVFSKRTEQNFSVIKKFKSIGRASVRIIISVDEAEAAAGKYLYEEDQRYIFRLHVFQRKEFHLPDNKEEKKCINDNEYDLDHFSSQFSNTCMKSCFVRNCLNLSCENGYRVFLSETTTCFVVIVELLQ